MKLDKDLQLGLGILVLIAVFFTILFGLAGLRTVAAIFFLFFLPFYLILDNFDLSTAEKAIFSLFIGLGMFSALTYFLALGINSIRIAMVVIFVLLITAAFLIKKLKK